MPFRTKWNRRGFLGTAAAIAASVFAPRKLFSAAGQAAGTTVTGFDKDLPRQLVGLLAELRHPVDPLDDLAHG